MIVGFSKHGQGNGTGPTKYLVDKNRVGREDNPPKVLRGDPQLTKQLIDSLDFKHKYTSGVLSFAPNEEITAEMENTIMDRFESLAFAGLNPDQYNILWVRHSHAGHHEMHFVTPRVELSTQKSLNISPPGQKTQDHFDDFRSEINARYGLADPTDPARAKTIATPDHELKIASEAIRRGGAAPDNMRELIDTVLIQRAEQGLIKNRKDVLDNIKDLGLNTTRAGKNYITVQDPETNQRWRLKGNLYDKEFTPSRTIEKSNAERKRDYSAPDQRAYAHCAEQVARHISARAKYNRGRYTTAKQKNRLENAKEQMLVASNNKPECLSGHILRELGMDAIYNDPDSRSTAKPSDIRAAGREGTAEQMRGDGQVMRENKRRSPNLPRRLQDFEGVLKDDGTRNTLIEYLENFGATIQQATTVFRERASRFNETVRNYIQEQSNTERASEQLKQSSRKLEQSITTVSQKQKVKSYSGPSL